MTDLNNKTILLISPQPWGDIYLSKHHYAIALAKKGNKVFFLNPITTQKTSFGKIVTISPIEGVGNLFKVDFCIYSSFILKFHLRFLFDKILAFHIANHLLKALPKLAVVWDFDCGLFYKDLNAFNTDFSIYQPVDQIANLSGNTKNAQVVFSISSVILANFKDSATPHFLLNHGLGRIFADSAQAFKPDTWSQKGKIKFCYSGNLLIPLIEKEVLKKVITQFENVEFHFIGPFSYHNNNVSGYGTISAEIEFFVGFLQQKSNVVLHGTKPQSEMVGIMAMMDGFFLCYDNAKDPNKGSNSHKIMEYLSFGKVVVSSRISAYDGTDILAMVADDDNSNFLPLFEHVVNNIEVFNSIENQQKRINFALDNTYTRQIEKIEVLIKDL